MPLLLLTAFALGAAPHSGFVVASASDPTEPDPMQRPHNWVVTGPMGGDVRSLVIDPRDARRLYLGTIDGQIYTSTDGGASWARLSGFNRPGLYIDNLIVDRRDSKILYAAAHRHKEPGGFFKSTDGGATWRDSDALKREAIHALGQSTTEPNVILAGTNNGVYRSEDGGETWKHMPTAGMTNTNVESLAIDPRDSKVVYAGTWHLPFKSTNGGESWNATKTGIIDDSDVFAIEIDERNPDHIIASACSGIYETRNAGASWRKVNGIPSQSRRTRAILQHPAQPRTIFAGTTEGFWMSQDGGDTWKVTTSRQAFEVNAIAVHPEEPQTVYIGTNNYGVMISRDGGKSWAPSNDGYSGRRAYAIVSDLEQPSRVYASTINTATGGGYFYVSEDGGQTWRLSTRNMPGRLITYSILQDPADANVIYLGTNLGLYRSADRGATWAPVAAPKPKPAPAKRRGRVAAGRSASASAAVPSASDARLAQRTPPTPNEQVKRAQVALNVAGYNVGAPDGVAGTRTVTALRQFQAAKNIPVSGKFDEVTLAALGLAGGMQTAEGGAAQAVKSAPVFLSDTINALVYYYDRREGRAGMLAATNAGLFRTYDPAQGWDFIPYNAGFDARTLSVSTTEHSPRTVFVGTSNSGVLVSRDGGESWEQVAGVPAVAPVNVVAQDPKRPSHVYAGTTQTFYVSQDGGAKWLRRGGNLPLGSYTSVLVNPENPDEVFVGDAWERGGGVFRSADAGMSWKRVDPTLPSQRVWALAFDPNDPGKLLVGSHSAGVYLARRDAGASAAASR